MYLEVHERLQLLQFIPNQGTYEALKTWRQQREMLSFTPEEIEALDFKNVTQPDGNVRTEWNAAKASKVTRDIPIPQYCHSYYQKKLAELQKEGKLTEQTMSLFEKFVVMAFK